MGQVIGIIQVRKMGSEKWKGDHYPSPTDTSIIRLMPDGAIWAVEITRSSAPKVESGFHIACADAIVIGALARALQAAES